jgi:hypothetical protein
MKISWDFNAIGVNDVPAKNVLDFSGDFLLFLCRTNFLHMSNSEENLRISLTCEDTEGLGGVQLNIFSIFDEGLEFHDYRHRVTSGDFFSSLEAGLPDF